MTTNVKDQALRHDMTKPVNNKGEILAADLIDLFTNEPRWDQLVDEVYRQYRPLRSLHSLAEEYAEDLGLTLIDPYALEEEVYCAYEAAEKGLS